MEARLSSNVADLSDERRKTIESLIGQPLHSDQVLYWVVMKSGHKPTATDKAQARAGLQQLFDEVDHHVAASAISPDDFEAAVDEAVQHVRSHPVE